jgi:hypothetical protein
VEERKRAKGKSFIFNFRLDYRHQVRGVQVASESTMLDIHQEQRVNFTGDPPNSQFPHDFVNVNCNGNIAAVDSGFPPPPRPPPNHNYSIPRKRQWGPPQGTLLHSFPFHSFATTQFLLISFLLQIKSMLPVMLKFTLHLFPELHPRLMYVTLFFSVV